MRVKRAIVADRDPDFTEVEEGVRRLAGVKASEGGQVPELSSGSSSASTQGRGTPDGISLPRSGFSAR